MTDKPVKPPLKPLLVLLIAVLLPGMGQIANNQATRGLLFAFTTVALGYVTSKYAAPDATPAASSSMRWRSWMLTAGPRCAGKSSTTRPPANSPHRRPYFHPAIRITQFMVALM